jgi:hypothetical protein
MIPAYDLPKVIVTALAHRRSENRLFAATLGRGLYYTYTSGIPRLRVLAISKWLAGKRRPGIEILRRVRDQRLDRGGYADQPAAVPRAPWGALSTCTRIRPRTPFADWSTLGKGAILRDLGVPVRIQ